MYSYGENANFERSFWIIIQWIFDFFFLKQQIKGSILNFCMQINANQAHLRKKSFQMKEPFPYLFELTSMSIDNIDRIISSKYRNRLISITVPVKSYSLITNNILEYKTNVQIEDNQSNFKNIIANILYFNLLENSVPFFVPLYTSFP